MTDRRPVVVRSREGHRGEALLAVAGRVGTTRLIDNLPVLVGPGGHAPRDVLRMTGPSGIRSGVPSTRTYGRRPR